jgi:hypothetical protein
MPIPVLNDAFKTAGAAVPGLRAVLVETDGDYARADGYSPSMCSQVDVQGIEWPTVNQGLSELLMGVSCFFFEPDTTGLVDRFFAFDSAFIPLVRAADYGTGYSYAYDERPVALELLHADAEMVIARARYTVHLYRSTL